MECIISISGMYFNTAYSLIKIKLSAIHYVIIVVYKSPANVYFNVSEQQNRCDLPFLSFLSTVNPLAIMLLSLTALIQFTLISRYPNAASNEKASNQSNWKHFKAQLTKTISAENNAQTESVRIMRQGMIIHDRQWHLCVVSIMSQVIKMFLRNTFTVSYSRT